MKYCLLFFVLLSVTISSSQETLLPEDLTEDFIFIQDLSGKPALVTQKVIYRFENKWTKTNFKNTLTKKDSTAIYSSYEFNNKNYLPVHINNQVQFVLNGGGIVLSLSGDELKRIDNSVDQQNQFGGAVFTHNNQHHVYGGYGFWKFKNYTTYFDDSTGQWQYLISNPETPPPGRWKSLFQTIDNKLFVLGGRASLIESNSVDVLINDYFVYNLDSKSFDIKGNFNPEIPIKSSNKKGFLIKSKKAYAKKNELVIIDFLKEEMNQINSKDLFENLDNNQSVFESQDTLYYISNFENKRYLSKLAISELSRFKNTTYPIILPKKKENVYLFVLIVLLTVLVSWLLYGLFRYKDLLKEFILFDENKLYLSNSSAQISLKQYKAIANLTVSGQLTSLELNEIISSKNKFSKSHLTLLRQKFIKELNSVFQKLTKTQTVYIKELKGPNDRRFLIYKTTHEVLKKLSFGAFLFKR